MRPEENDYLNQEQFSVYNVQQVENLFSDVNKMTEEQVSQARSGWRIHRKFSKSYAGKEKFYYDPNYFYNGFIDEYSIKRTITSENEDYYYIKFTCSVYIDDFGFYSFNYDIPATCTHKSKFTQLMCDLGINLSQFNCVDLDKLVGTPIKAHLSTKDGFTKIDRIVSRY